MDLFIKTVKKTRVVQKNAISIKDIAEVYAPANYKAQIEAVKVKMIEANKKENYIISVIDIIKAVSNEYPSLKINMLGEAETLVEYLPNEKKANVIWVWIKVLLVAVVLFAGAMTAIMSFHTDAQIPKVLENYYYIFFGEKVEKPLIITIPYSIGIAVGIIAFYNHFSKLFVTKDPTPLQVEMTAYESQVDDCIKDNIEKQKGS